MKTRLFSILIIALLATVSIVSATTETRYMRSDTETVNGLTAYILNATQSSTYATRLIGDFLPSTTQCYVGIRVWYRNSDSTEHEITSGSAVAVTYSTTSQLKSATWSCPETALVSTDSIVVRVYGEPDNSAPTALVETFSTEQLGASWLNASTWTVYYYIYRVAQGGGNYAYSYRFGSSTYNSRIENIVWTAAAAGPTNYIVDLTASITNSFTTQIHTDFAISTGMTSSVAMILKLSYGTFVEFVINPTVSFVLDLYQGVISGKWLMFAVWSLLLLAVFALPIFVIIKRVR
jgi:hypothetical protein